MAVDRYKWPLQIQHGAPVTPKTRVRQAQFGDGYTQVAEDGINGVQLSYQLEFTGNNRSQWKPREIRDFLLAHVTQAFIFTPPGSAQGLYIVAPDSVEYIPLAKDVYTVRAILNQAAGAFA
ncbi:tail tip protein M [Serratia phage vB_SmaM-ChibiTotoro]|nr:tail tip protein M [Serratia phage vB_SmaM-ChibiTotoro]